MHHQDKLSRAEIFFPPYRYPEDFQNAINLERHLVDLPLSELVVANLGAGHADSAFAQQVASLPFKTLYQVEIHPPYLASLYTMDYAAQNVSFCDIDLRDWVSWMPDNVDVVILTDVIEHLSKASALYTLEKLRNRAKRRIIIWLPMGACAQHEYDNNPHQEHQSEWSPRDFDFDGTTIEYYKAFHKHIEPNADAAWVILTPNQIQ